MTSAKRIIVGTLVTTVAAAVAVFAQPPNLNVRMGLWEVTGTMNLGGDVPMPDMSKMTPQQRQQMEAAMKGMMGSHTSTDTSCISKDDFDAAQLMGGTDEKNCKQTITTNTPSTLEASVVCTGDHPMTATMHVDALSQTAIKATFKSTNTEQGKTMLVNGTIAGKWLKADCGDKK